MPPTDLEATAKAQEAFAHRARLNGAARYGRYTESMEKELNGVA